MLTEIMLYAVLAGVFIVTALGLVVRQPNKATRVSVLSLKRKRVKVRR